MAVERSFPAYGATPNQRVMKAAQKVITVMERRSTKKAQVDSQSKLRQLIESSQIDEGKKTDNDPIELKA